MAEGPVKSLRTLLVGMAGQGKSAISNMLSDCPIIKKESVFSIATMVTDTEFGHLTITDASIEWICDLDTAVHWLVELLDFCIKGIDVILLVIEPEMLDEWFLTALRLLIYIVGDDYHDKMVIVITSQQPGSAKVEHYCQKWPVFSDMLDLLARRVMVIDNYLEPRTSFQRQFIMKEIFILLKREADSIDTSRPDHLGQHQLDLESIETDILTPEASIIRQPESIIMWLRKRLSVVKENPQVWATASSRYAWSLMQKTLDFLIVLDATKVQQSEILLFRHIPKIPRGAINDELFWALCTAGLATAMFALESQFLHQQFDRRSVPETDPKKIKNIIAQATQLWIAAKFGHFAIAELVISNDKTQVTHRNGNGETALWIAAKEGQLEIAKLIISFQKDLIGIPNNRGETPLWTAAEAGQLEIVEFIAPLDKDQLSISNYNDESPLWIAAKSGNFEIVKLIASLDKSLASKENFNGETPLWIAARMGWLKIVKFIINARKDLLTIANHYGTSPLWIAARYGHFAIVEFIVSIDKTLVAHPNKNQETPLWIAAENGCFKIVELIASVDKNQVLIQNKKGESPLWIAAKIGHFKIVELIISLDKTQVAISNIYGETPLWIAAEMGQVEIFKLIASIVNDQISIPNDRGESPLWIAAKRGHFAIVKLIVSKDKSQITTTNANGDSPLYIAAENGHFEIVKLIASKDKAQAWFPNKHNETPYFVAKLKGRSRIAEYLASFECEVDHSLTKDIIPFALHSAIDRGDLDRIKFVVSSDEKMVTAKNENGETLLWLASERGHTAIVEYLLLKYGAVLSIPNRNGETPLWIAAKNGHTDIVRFITTKDRALISVPNKEGETPLWIAVKHGHFLAVQIMAWAKEDSISIPNLKGETPLLIAASNGYLGIVDFIARRDKASVTISDNNGLTPITIAAKNGKSNIVQYFFENYPLQAASEIFSAVQEKQNLLMDRFFKSIPSLISLRNTDGFTALHVASISGYIDIIKQVTTDAIISIINCETCDKRETPLTLALANGQEDFAIELLKMGADIRHTTSYYWTGLMIASKNVDIKCTEVFEKLAADDLVLINHKDQDGICSLSLACFFGHEIAAAFLIRKGASVNVIDNHGASCLIQAAKGGFANIAKLLLTKNDFDKELINHRDKHGRTALFCAANNGHVEFIRILLDYGVEDIPDKKGATALWIAAKYGHFTISKMLAEYFPKNVHKSTDDEITPMQIATNYGHQRIAEYLSSL